MRKSIIICLLVSINMLFGVVTKGHSDINTCNVSAKLFNGSSMHLVNGQTETGKGVVGNSTVKDRSWETIKNETFEGAWPNDWNCYSENEIDCYWSDNNDRAYEGNWSGYCADGGNESQSGGYLSGMETWMVYGPFSLADCNDAELNYRVWYETESNYDYFKVYASTDGQSYWGLEYSGNSNGWQNHSFDLTDVYTLGNVIGKNNVWIAFEFESDSSITYEGVYVDNVDLRKNYIAPDIFAAPSIYSIAVVNGVDMNEDNFYESFWLQLDVDAVTPTLRDVVRAEECFVEVIRTDNDQIVCTGGPFHFTGMLTSDNAYVGPISMQEWNDNSYFEFEVVVTNNLGTSSQNISVPLQGLYTPNADDVNQAYFTSLKNYPNPFNPETTISFTLKQREHVTLEIFNAKGQLVNKLVSETLNAGTHSLVWKGNDKDGKKAASGVYFYRLTTPTISSAERMLLMK
ncbi:MAG: T9SS type A sorting domain-containing protein [Candidatus Cloacimonetes bacterium]|nr:T9SS type A sorting domain-containing protein [Candidatus Cloacimonadota bacterium]